MTTYRVFDDGESIEIAEEDTPRSIYFDDWGNGEVLLTIDTPSGHAAQIVLNVSDLWAVVSHFEGLALRGL